MTDLSSPRLFYPLVPDTTLPGDWFAGRIPANIEAGENSVIDSSFCFKHFFSKNPIGFRVGRDVTIWRASFGTAEGSVAILVCGNVGFARGTGTSAGGIGAPARCRADGNDRRIAFRN